MSVYLSVCPSGNVQQKGSEAKTIFTELQLATAIYRFSSDSAAKTRKEKKTLTLVTIDANTMYQDVISFFRLSLSFSLLFFLLEVVYGSPISPRSFPSKLPLKRGDKRAAGRRHTYVRTRTYLTISGGPEFRAK